MTCDTNTYGRLAFAVQVGCLCVHKSTVATGTLPRGIFKRDSNPLQIVRVVHDQKLSLGCGCCGGLYRCQSFAFPREVVYLCVPHRAISSRPCSIHTGIDISLFERASQWVMPCAKRDSLPLVPTMSCPLSTVSHPHAASHVAQWILYLQVIGFVKGDSNQANPVLQCPIQLIPLPICCSLWPHIDK